MEGSPTQSDGVSVVITKTVDPMEYEKHTPLEEIKPDHYFDDGRIPVFKPVSAQLFRGLSFRKNWSGMNARANFGFPFAALQIDPTVMKVADVLDAM